MCYDDFKGSLQEFKMREESALTAIENDLTGSDETRRLSALEKVEALVASETRENEIDALAARRFLQPRRLLALIVYVFVWNLLYFTFIFGDSAGLMAMLLPMLHFPAVYLILTMKTRSPETTDFKPLFRSLLVCPHPRAIPLLLKVHDYTNKGEQEYTRALLPLLPHASPEIAARLSSRQWDRLHSILHTYTFEALEAARFISRFGSKEDLEELSDWVMSFPISEAHEELRGAISDQLLPMMERTLADVSLLLILSKLEDEHRKAAKSFKPHDYEALYRRNYLSLWYLLEHRREKSLNEYARNALLRLLSERDPVYDLKLPLAIIDTLGEAKEVAALPVFRQFASRKPSSVRHTLIADACKRWIPILEASEHQQNQAQMLLRAGATDEALLRASERAASEEPVEHLLRGAQE